jgi:hypothetical protein
MIHHRKYETIEKFRLSPKEIDRASDGITIIVRPQESGSIGVFAIDVVESTPVGINWYEVDSKSDLPDATRLLNRDLDKFHGLGWPMSSHGRHRDKGPKVYASHVKTFPVGAKVLVDGRDEAIVKQVFPLGSSSFMWPHYKLDFVDGDRNVVVALSRVGVDRKKSACTNFEDALLAERVVARATKEFGG